MNIQNDSKRIVRLILPVVILLIVSLSITAQIKRKTKTNKKINTPKISVSKSKENKTETPQKEQSKVSDYDFGVYFEIKNQSFLFQTFTYRSVTITNRDRRPATIKKVTANGEQNMDIGRGLNDDPNKVTLPKILTIGDKILLVPSNSDYKKELIFIDIETDLGIQTYKVKQ